MQKRFCPFFVIKVKKKEFLAKMNNCETKIAKNIKREFISGDKTHAPSLVVVRLNMKTEKDS